MTNTLGDRMKFYESQYRTKLVPALPTIIRLDGKAFHSWTKECERPFDDKLIQLFQRATYRLMNEMCTNATLAYSQSDEVTIVIPARAKNQELMFKGKHDKTVSVIASALTVCFIYAMEEDKHWEDKQYPMFDARAFNVPSKEEVVNALIWRQQDATRNSIQMYGQNKFSQKQLHQKDCNQIQEMLFQEHQINWNDVPIHKKRGWTIRRQTKLVGPNDIDMKDIPLQYRPTEPIERKELELDMGVPVFTADRDYILNLL